MSSRSTLTSRTDLLDSGVVVNTIAFGPEAPGNLMAQIAADTGGIYRPVATSGGGAGVMAAGADAVAAFDALNLPVEASAVMAAAYLPGQLGLANVYDYFDTEAQGAARVINMNYTDVPAFDQPNSVKEMAIIVDKSVNQLRLVVAGKQPDEEGCRSQRHPQGGRADAGHGSAEGSLDRISPRTGVTRRTGTSATIASTTCWS
jgi:hypothetical protein